MGDYFDAAGSFDAFFWGNPTGRKWPDEAQPLDLAVSNGSTTKALGYLRDFGRAGKTDDRRWPEFLKVCQKEAAQEIDRVAVEQWLGSLDGWDGSPGPATAGIKHGRGALETVGGLWSIVDEGSDGDSVPGRYREMMAVMSAAAPTLLRKEEQGPEPNLQWPWFSYRFVRVAGLWSGGIGRRFPEELAADRLEHIWCRCHPRATREGAASLARLVVARYFQGRSPQLEYGPDWEPFPLEGESESDFEARIAEEDRVAGLEKNKREQQLSRYHCLLPLCVAWEVRDHLPHLAVPLVLCHVLSFPVNERPDSLDSATYWEWWNAEGSGFGRDGSRWWQLAKELLDTRPGPHPSAAQVEEAIGECNSSLSLAERLLHHHWPTIRAGLQRMLEREYGLDNPKVGVGRQIGPEGHAWVPWWTCHLGFRRDPLL